MNEVLGDASTARSWRHIPQELKLPAMSSRGRRRVFAASARTTLVVVLVGALALGGVTIATSRVGNPKVAPVRTIALQTDGVLDVAWVDGVLAVPTGTALGDIDLGQLRTRLLATNRVSDVSLSRKFPSTLVVSLSERFPVARIRTEGEGDLLIDRAGIVFPASTDQDREAYDTLPWLAGIRLARGAAGFLPVAGLDAVAELLTVARIEIPERYRTWLSLDLSRLEAFGEIAVQAKDGPRMVFGTAASSDFRLQAARLDYVLDHAAAPIRSIDLSLGTDAVVVYETTTALSLSNGHSSSVTPSAFTKQLTLTRP